MTTLVANTSYRGAWPALLTPSTPDGGVDVHMLEQLTAYLLDKGADGLYVCGSTGEGVSLSVPERCRVAETVAARVAGHLPLIIHVGAVATRDAVALARHARSWCGWRRQYSSLRSRHCCNLCALRGHCRSRARTCRSTPTCSVVRSTHSPCYKSSSRASPIWVGPSIRDQICSSCRHWLTWLGRVARRQDGRSSPAWMNSAFLLLSSALQPTSAARLT